MVDHEDTPPSAFTIPLMQGIVGLVLFGALVAGEQNLTLLCLLVLVLGGTTRLWGRIAGHSVSCHMRVDRERLFPGEKVRVQARVENKKPIPVRFRLRPFQGEGLQPLEPGPQEESGVLLWFQSITVSWEFLAERRGIYLVGPPSLAAGDPFGFTMKGVGTGAPLPLVVFPRIVPIRLAPFLGRAPFGQANGRHLIEDPVCIVGTRDYQAVQPARFIHWKASARHHRLQQKVFQPSVRRKILLIVAMGSYASGQVEEAFERTLEVVGSLALRLERQGLAVGLWTVGPGGDGQGTLIPPGRGQGQVGTLLETLAGLTLGPQAKGREPPLTTGLLPNGASCLLFCHHPNEEVAQALEALRRVRAPVLLVTIDAWGEGGGQGEDIPMNLDAFLEDPGGEPWNA